MTASGDYGPVPLLMDRPLSIARCGGQNSIHFTPARALSGGDHAESTRHHRLQRLALGYKGHPNLDGLMPSYAPRADSLGDPADDCLQLGAETGRPSFIRDFQPQ